jgi:hypothetical protein
VICIGCGCNEREACVLPGGVPCAWVHVGRAGLAGICSACVELFPPSTIESELAVRETAIAEARPAPKLRGRFPDHGKPRKPVKQL